MYTQSIQFNGGEENGNIISQISKKFKQKFNFCHLFCPTKDRDLFSNITYFKKGAWVV